MAPVGGSRQGFARSSPHSHSVQAGVPASRRPQLPPRRTTCEHHHTPIATNTSTTMFEARLVEGKIFKQIVESVKDLVTDANLFCTAEGISYQSMDAAHVALVAFELNANGFDHYRCDKGVTLGFNSANMSKILKMMGSDDIIYMKAEDEPNKLTMVFESPKTETIADFELNLMDITNEEMQIPDAEYDCTVKMPAGEFQRIVRDLQVLGDTCSISCTKEGIKFSVDGNIGSGSILTRSNAASDKDSEQVVIDLKEPVDLNLALRYLNFFTKATPLSGQVILSMSPDVPIVVEYPIGDMGHMKFFLAPKIDDEDDE